MPKHSSKPNKKPKLPADMNQRGKAIVDFLTDSDEILPEDKPIQAPKPEKDPAAVSLGRRGGLKGGNARAASLTAEQRSEIAKKAAMKRWGETER
jgi:hypothetical protein